MDGEEKPYNALAVHKLENSEVEIRGEIPLYVMEQFRKDAVQKLSDKTAIPGFRKGHIPEQILVNKIGETAILEEVAEQALSHAYQQIMRDHKIDSIGQPHISITKLAPKNPIGFTIRTAVYPTITLPDYREIAKKIRGENPPAGGEKIEVTDKELDDTILQIQKSKMAISKKDTDTAADGAPDASSEASRELTDELVQSWNFKDVADFRIKLRNDMLKEKTMKEKEKNRMGDTIQKPSNRN